MTRSMTLFISILFSISLFAAGYYCNEELRWRSYEKVASSMQDIDQALAESSSATRTVKLIEENKCNEVAEHMLGRMNFSIRLAQSHTSGGGKRALKMRRLEKKLWKQDIETIRTCAKAHGLSDTVKRADEILKWFDQGDSVKKKE